MALVWSICGSGRGVGKTHLALALRGLLPNAVYAKLGHGKPKPGKPGSFFNREADLAAFIEQSKKSHEHIIVESNRWARNGSPDITIFVDRGFGTQSDRQDVNDLRASADICVGPGARQARWKRALLAKLPDKQLAERVCDLLRSHKRFTDGAELTARTKVWLVSGDGHVFGLGLSSLLGNVERLGSLADAARAAKISYRRAWDLVRLAEDHLGKPLIVRRAGGVGGGSSVLSAEGRWLLGVFKQLHREVAAYADAKLRQHLKNYDTH